MSDIPPVLNALWWNVDEDREAVFAVPNVADERAEADVSLDFDGVQHGGGSLKFGTHETKLLSLKELLRDLHNSCVDCGRTFGSADRDDHACSDEERRSHLRPVRNFLAAADFHLDRPGES